MSENTNFAIASIIVGTLVGVLIGMVIVILAWCVRRRVHPSHRVYRPRELRQVIVVPNPASVQQEILVTKVARNARK